MTSAPIDVSITAHARLHLGFLDLDGGLGRRFGGLGLGLDAPATHLRLARADALGVEGAEAGRARAALLTLCEAHGRAPRFHLTIERAIPAHSGLGSGTQLALAIGRAFALLEGLELSTRDIAAALGRGARSGIGIATFDQGGLVLDGGRGRRTVVPPILTRLTFPEDWRVLLLFDDSAKGVHGQEERRAFQELPPVPPETAAHLCRLTVMQALPAVLEADLPAFGAAIAEIQAVMGRHFAPAQGGHPYTSPQVAKALGWLLDRGVSGIGQSSWGPTGFAFLPDEGAARGIMEALRRDGLAGTLTPAIAKARNQGAEISVKGRPDNKVA
jgi:beta-ribofuranosylaminobenzene 5'-phosphate synthase